MNSTGISPPKQPGCESCRIGLSRQSLACLLGELYMTEFPPQKNLCKRKIIPTSICVSCIVGEEENDDHLFLNWRNADNLWTWLSEVMNYNFKSFHTVIDIIRWGCKQNFKIVVRELRLLVTLYACWVIWFYRNQLVFERKEIPALTSIAMLRRYVTASVFLIKGKAYNFARDAVIFGFFGVKTSYYGPKLIKEVRWIFPPPAWIKVNIDGAARGNPGHQHAEEFTESIGISWRVPLLFLWVCNQHCMRK